MWSRNIFLYDSTTFSADRFASYDYVPAWIAAKHLHRSTRCHVKCNPAVNPVKAEITQVERSPVLLRRCQLTIKSVPTASMIRADKTSSAVVANDRVLNRPTPNPFSTINADLARARTSCLMYQTTIVCQTLRDSTRTPVVSGRGRDLREY